MNRYSLLGGDHDGLEVPEVEGHYFTMPRRTKPFDYSASPTQDTYRRAPPVHIEGESGVTAFHFFVHKGAGLPVDIKALIARAMQGRRAAQPAPSGKESDDGVKLRTRLETAIDAVARAKDVIDGGADA